MSNLRIKALQQFYIEYMPCEGDNCLQLKHLLEINTKHIKVCLQVFTACFPHPVKFILLLDTYTTAPLKEMYRVLYLIIPIVTADQSGLVRCEVGDETKLL